MKTKVVIGALVILVFVFGWFTFSSSLSKVQETSVSKSHFPSTLSASGNITCNYPQVMHASYQLGKITHELPKPETNPIIMTFTDLQSDVAKIQFIDSTQTISEVSVVKILDTKNKLIFVEGSGEIYTTLHTIYKDTGVSMYAKHASLLGTPVGTISMGTCVDY